MARPGRHRQQYRVREATPPRYASASPPDALTGVLLDSDVIIDMLRGRAETVAELRRLEAAGTATYTCAVSVAEIFVGVRPGEEARTEAFFEARGTCDTIRWTASDSTIPRPSLPDPPARVYSGQRESARLSA